MNYIALITLFIPLLGTVLGASMVYFLKNQISDTANRMLIGFAAGVMVAASVWSLIIPSIDASINYGKFAFLPAAIGFMLGIFFLLALDHFIPHMHMDGQIEGKKSKLGKHRMMFLAVTLHNIPEGMALGVVLAALINESNLVSIASTFALALGIALQNFPEGAIVSLPLKGEGLTKTQSFAFGAFSGVVEPIATVITLLFASVIEPVLPYCLSFAAGAMIYVVVEELIPSMSEGKHSNIGTLFFAFGFVLMMILDVALA